jgi:hypothetical protein
MPPATPSSPNYLKTSEPPEAGRIIVRYFSESKAFVMVECDKCKRVLNVSHERVKIIGALWEIAPPLYCSCGAVADSVTGNRPPRSSPPRAGLELVEAPSKSIPEIASAVAGVVVLIMVLGGIWLTWSTCAGGPKASQPPQTISSFR